MQIIIPEMYLYLQPEILKERRLRHYVNNTN
jgi:hypothetical protein